MLRSATQVLPMNMQKINSMETIQLHDPAPINAPIPTGNKNEEGYLRQGRKIMKISMGKFAD